jgi:8-oxo-dGTP diphosphatase
MVRHAVAVDRGSWQGDDALRPLTAEGEHQAEALGRWLGGFDPSPLLSSPTLRCVATLQPYVAATGKVIVRRPELLPDRVGEAIALVRRMLPSGGLVCTHGEVIEPVLEALALRIVNGPSGESAKGSVWVLELDGAAVSGQYISPEQIERESLGDLGEVGRRLTDR